LTDDIDYGYAEGDTVYIRTPQKQKGAKKFLCSRKVDKHKTFLALDQSAKDHVVDFDIAVGTQSFGKQGSGFGGVRRSRFCNADIGDPLMSRKN
jgi:hypothetical protein